MVTQHTIYHTNSQVPYIVTGTCELDSHADTCVAGLNCIILEYTQQTINVSDFSPEQGELINIPIVAAATAFDDPKTDITSILIIGQAVHLGDKGSTTLLCPNQLQSSGIIVDDVPIHLANHTRPSTHSIQSSEDNMMIPLTLKGCISYFNTCTPTQDELQTCKWISLTDEFF